MRNEAKRQALEIIRCEIAESFVFKGLIGFSFRRFHEEPWRRHDARPPLMISGPPIIADNSEDRNDLSRPILCPARIGVLTIRPRLSIACGS